MQAHEAERLPLPPALRQVSAGSNSSSEPSTPPAARSPIVDSRSPASIRKPSPADFMFGETLGEGAYARVVHARMKASMDEFAVKIMEKRFIKKENKVKFVMMEKQVFSKVQHERIVKLYFTFQDHNYLYMVMEICRGGELLDVILNKHKKKQNNGIVDQACSLEETRFYIAEIVQALEYLHTNSIIHRDLKPENILLTEKGHIKITDFGTAKDESNAEGRANTFCGTAEYVSPEVLRDQDASRGCDLWALGCMIFQLLVGRPMFRAENEYLTFQQILNFKPEEHIYPTSVPAVAVDLCNRLLRQDPHERLGSGTDAEGNGYEALKSHEFFSGTEWENLSKSTPPHVPEISELPPTDNDGATEDWLFAGVATELQVSGPSPKAVLRNSLVEQQHHQSHQHSDAHLSHTHHVPSHEHQAGAAMRTGASLWNRFLLDDETVKFTALISKRKGLFSKKRQLILTSRPRLIYVDPVKMKQKGEIPWSEQVYVQLKNQSNFDIVTPNRIYHITDPVHGSQRWSDAINEALVSSGR